MIPGNRTSASRCQFPKDEVNIFPASLTRGFFKSVKGEGYEKVVYIGIGDGRTSG